MTHVHVTESDGTVREYDTSCPLFVFVELTDPFQDPEDLRAAYDD